MSLIKKLEENKDKIGPKVNNCLENVCHGWCGRLQYFHTDNEIYCLEKAGYCPAQKDIGKGLKICKGQELYLEYVKNNK